MLINVYVYEEQQAFRGSALQLVHRLYWYDLRISFKNEGNSKLLKNTICTNLHHLAKR